MAGATATVRVPSGGPLNPFSADHLLAPPAGHAVVELELDLEASGSSQLQIPVDAVVLSLLAHPDARLRWRNLLALPSTTPLRQALGQLLAQSHLPAHLAVLAPWQATALAATFELELGLAAKLGTRVAFDATPFASISEDLEARFQAVLRASLALSLLEEMELVVGNLDVLKPGRVRILLRRLRERKLDFGTTFRLRVKYDAGSPFLALLDETVGSRPVARILAALRELSRLSAVIARGDWEAARHQMSADMVEILADLLGEEDLWRWLESSEEAQDLLESADRLVSLFDAATSDELLRSLWERLLGRVDMGAGSPLRNALERIAALDPDDLAATVASILDERFATAVELLELLAGRDFEQILLADEEARTAVSTAVRLAREAIQLVEQTPEKLAQLLRGIVQRSGIAKAVDQLRRLRSVEGLRQASHATAARLAERLLGKALERLDEDDLEAVRSWAGELYRTLHGAGLERLDAALRDELARLEGEAGFSVALELERLTRTSAIVDVEVDAELLPRLNRHLRAGSVTGLLEALHATGDGDSPRPYTIRDCVLTSRRASTSAISLLLALAGWRGSQRRELSETRVRVSGPVEGGVKRQARFSGGVTCLERSGDRTSFAASTWLDLRCADREGQSDLAAPYEAVAAQLRISVSRQDAKALAEELDATRHLLRDLGFDEADRGPVDKLVDEIPPGAPTRLGLTLRLPQPAILAFLSELEDPGGWDRDVLNAASRWLDEGLLTNRLPQTQLRKGRCLATVVTGSTYRKGWRQGREVFAQRHHSGFTVTLPRGHRRRFRLAPLERYPVLLTLQSARPAAPGDLALVTALLAGETVLTPGALLAAAVGFASTMRRLSPPAWPSPLFLLWLVVARAGRLAPDALADVRGSGSLRWQVDEVWQPPVRLRMTQGLRIHAPGGKLFPLKRA